MQKVLRTSLLAAICIANEVDPEQPSVVHESEKLKFDRDDKAAYQKDWAKLYGFSVVDFFVSDKRPTGSEIELSQEEAVVTPGYDKHAYAEPSECLICYAEAKEIEELESRVQFLEWRYETI